MGESIKLTVESFLERLKSLNMPCVSFCNQKRKPKLYLIPAGHFLSTPVSSLETVSVRATSSVSEVERSTPSKYSGMGEFEMDLQELFDEVKAMVQNGKERDAMDLLRANYVSVKEEMDSVLKGIKQVALLDIIALGYMAVGDLKSIPVLLDMINKIVDKLINADKQKVLVRIIGIVN